MASSVADPSFLEELSDNFLQCPVHLDRYEKPKMLPCLHSVCLSCLEQWQQKGGATDEVTCPQCRKMSPIPPEGIQSLPDNFLINSLLDYVDQQSGSDDESRKCDICGTSSPNSEVMRCVDCSMFLCGTCTASHKKIPSTANHQLIPMAEFAGMGVAEKLNLASPMCSKHPTSRLEFFFTKCKVPICTQCTVVAHKAPVHKIQELAEAYTKLKKQVESELKGTKKKHIKIQQEIANTTTNISELEIQRDLAFETAQQQAEKMIDLVSQYLAEIEEQIEQEFSDQKASLDERLENLLQLDEDFKHTQEFGNRILQFGNQVTLTSVGPDIMRKITELRTSCQEAEEGKINANLTFTANEEFVEDQLCWDSIGYIGNLTEEASTQSEDGSVPSTPTTTDVVETDLSFDEAGGTPSPEHTLIKRTYKGRSYPNKKLNLMILVRDCLGNTVDIDDTSVFQCQLRMPKIDDETKAALEKLGQTEATTSIWKGKDDSVMLSFMPNISGVFTLLLTMNGTPVKSYPYSVQVFPDKRKQDLPDAFSEMQIEDDDTGDEGREWDIFGGYTSTRRSRGGSGRGGSARGGRGGSRVGGRGGRGGGGSSSTRGGSSARGGGKGGAGSGGSRPSGRGGGSDGGKGGRRGGGTDSARGRGSSADRRRGGHNEGRGGRSKNVSQGGGRGSGRK